MLFIRIVFVLWLGLETVCGQDITQPTEVKLEYWRSFHGVIKQEVSIVDGKMSIRTKVMHGMSAEEQSKNTESSNRVIELKDLEPIVSIFNQARNREYFMKTPFDDRLDGSSIAITIVQNQFSITFCSQDAFDKNSQKSSVLGRAARLLFKLAELKVPEEELY